MHIIKPLPGTLPMPGRPLADANALWPMNSLGDQIYDLSGNGNTGTLVADTHWVPGKFGPALSFDGAEDNVRIENSPELFGMSQLTLVVRARYQGIERADEYNLIDGWGTGDTNYLLRFDDDAGENAIQFFTDTSLGTAGGNFAGTDMSDQKEHHIVAVYDGSNMYVYFDGVKSSTSIAQTGAVDAGATHIEIGGHVASNDDDWLGLIDIPSIYNRALSASEIEKLYREPFCMFPEPIMPEFAISA